MLILFYILGAIIFSLSAYLILYVIGIVASPICAAIAAFLAHRRGLNWRTWGVRGFVYAISCGFPFLYLLWKIRNIQTNTDNVNVNSISGPYYSAKRTFCGYAPYNISTPRYFEIEFGGISSLRSGYTLWFSLNLIMSVFFFFIIGIAIGTDRESVEPIIITILLTPLISLVTSFAVLLIWRNKNLHRIDEMSGRVKIIDEALHIMPFGLVPNVFVIAWATALIV